MKKLLLLLLAAIMTISLSACGGDKKEPVKEEAAEEVLTDAAEKDAAEEETPTEEVQAFEPQTATWGDFTVTVLGAEAFKDADEKDAIRVYYDFTNESDYTESAWSVISFRVEQDGYELNPTYASWSDDVYVVGNELLGIRPGVTIRCMEEFSMKADGGNVVVEIYDYWEESDSITLEFDPQNLPGAPEDIWTAQTISDPEWTLAYSDTGTLYDKYDIHIGSAEFLEGDDGEALIRVYFDFTNNDEEATSFWFALTPKAYQDGIELETGSLWEGSETDENASVEIEPGESIQASLLFALRSDSKVEIEVTDWNDNAVGCTFDIE